MIGRTNRFHGRASIKRLYASSKSVRSDSLMLRYVPNPRRQDYRLAVVVSRKVSKSAVVRNRIRRRLYERVRILSSDFNAPYDLLIMVYDVELATASAATVDKEIAKLCKKAKLTSADTPVVL